MYRHHYIVTMETVMYIRTEGAAVREHESLLSDQSELRIKNNNAVVIRITQSASVCTVVHVEYKHF